MSWFAVASSKRGRSAHFSDAAIQFCLTIKNQFGLTLQQTTGFLFSLCWRRLSCRGQSPTSACCVAGSEVTYRTSSDGLHLLVDLTGIKLLGEGELEIQKAWGGASAPIAQAAYRH